MRKDFSILEGEKEVLLSTRSVQYDDIKEADEVYASKVASLVRQNNKRKLLLRSQLDDFLRSTGVWSKEDEDKITSINTEIDSYLSKIKKGGIKAAEGRKLCIDIMDKRKEIIKIMSKRQIFDDTTIESLAEAERNDYLVYCTTVFADSGEKYWPSFEDMKIDKDSDAYRKASSNALEVIYGINPEFEKRLPENRWLKKYNFIDDNLNYIDRKTGEKVDREGNKLKDYEDKVIKHFENLQGEIVEESPILDDDTGEPIVNNQEVKT
jgi:hypothetical protein